MKEPKVSHWTGDPGWPKRTGVEKFKAVFNTIRGQPLSMPAASKRLKSPRSGWSEAEQKQMKKNEKRRQANYIKKQSFARKLRGK